MAPAQASSASRAGEGWGHFMCWEEARESATAARAIASSQKLHGNSHSPLSSNTTTAPRPLSHWDLSGATAVGPAQIHRRAVAQMDPNTPSLTSLTLGNTHIQC